MKKKQKSTQKNYPKKNIFMFASVIIIVLSGIILPGNILALQEKKEYDQINAVEAQYLASSSAMARNVSSNLSTCERLQLIAGQWQSDIQEAKSYEMEQEGYEAVILARKKMKELYERRQYPADLSSKYANWYNWNASPYKAVDTTFHSYTAYYWVIQFEKYDKTETHTIQMLEDGTIFLADASMSGEINETMISEVPQTLPGVEGQTAVLLDTERKPIDEMMPYEADLSNLRWKGLTLITEAEGKDYFLLLQLLGTQRCLYVLAPYIHAQ